MCNSLDDEDIHLKSYLKHLQLKHSEQCLVIYNQIAITKLLVLKLHFGGLSAYGRHQTQL